VALQFSTVPSSRWFSRSSGWTWTELGHRSHLLLRLSASVVTARRGTHLSVPSVSFVDVSILGAMPFDSPAGLLSFFFGS
jgi:hypothetical protein